MRLLTAAWTSIVFLAVAPAGADDAQKVFDSLYGQRLAEAKASRDRGDDLALAREFLQAAKTVATDSPELLVILCNQAFELSSGLTAGYDTAIDAMRVLAEHDPKQQAAARDRMLALMQKQYTRARGSARDAAGAALLDALVEAAKGHAAEEAFDEAIAKYRRAVSVARVVRTSQVAPLNQAIDRLQHEQRVAQTIRQLKQHLEGAPDDAEAAQRLVMAYVVDLDAPDRAKLFLNLVKDEQVKKHTALANQPISTMPGETALALGVWYRELSNSCDSAAKPAMLNRARAYYEQFLRTHTKQDVQAVAAKLVLKDLTESMRRLGVRPYTPPTAAPPPSVVKAKPVTPAAPAAAPIRVAQFVAPDKAEGIHARQADDGRYITRVVNGKPVIRPGLPKQINHLYFDVDDAFAHDVPLDSTDTYTLIVALVDAKPGRFSLEYDAHPKPGVFAAHDGRWTGTPDIEMPGKGRVVSIRVDLIRPRLANRQQNLYDLRIRSFDGYAPLVHRVTIERKKNGSKAATAPVTPKPPAPSPRGPGWTDLLKGIDPNKLTVEGKWELTPQGLRNEPSSRFTRMRLPVTISGGYHLRLKYSRLTSDKAFNVTLPVGNHQAVLKLSAGNHHTSALEYINGQAYSHPNNPTRTTAFQATNGKAHTVDIRVAPKDDNATVNVEVDGKSLLNWSGPTSALTVWHGWRMPSTSDLGVGSWMSQVVIHEAAIRPVNGRVSKSTGSGAGRPPNSGRPSGPGRVRIGIGRPGGQTNPAAQTVGANQWIDLLKLNEPTRDAIGAPWRMDKGQLVSPNGQLFRLGLPVEPSGDYHLRCTFRREVGVEALSFILPIGGTTTRFVLNGWVAGGGASGISMIRGRDADSIPSTVRGKPIFNGRDHTLDAFVSSKDQTVTVRIILDGKPYMNWSGPKSDLRMRMNSGMRNRRQIGLSAWESVFRISELRLRMLSGQATLTRGGNGAVTPAGANTKPDDTKKGPKFFGIPTQ